MGSRVRVELFQGKDGWRWHLVAANGEILASSEGYSSKQAAERTAKLVSDALAGAKVD
jgi:uncharacterized protein YegP (UPF0339 family)